jgi:hypothetical protein
MRTIEIRVYEDGFADSLAAMRDWLEREKLYLAHFRHRNDDGMIVMSVGFANPDDPASMLFTGPSATWAKRRKLISPIGTRRIGLIIAANKVEQGRL